MPDNGELNKHLRLLRKIDRFTGKVDGIIGEVALVGLRILATATPSVTGHTRRSWHVLHPRAGMRIIENTSAVWASEGKVHILQLLGDGTGIHGPRKKRIRPIRAKALYLPITKRAKNGWNQSLVYGQDYVLVASVKGTRTNKRRRPIQTKGPSIINRLEKRLNTEFNKIFR